MTRRGRKTVITGAIAVGVLVWYVVDHVFLASMVGWVGLRNECEYPVKVAYSGSTIFERGSITLQPGQHERVIVYRGGGAPANGFAVRVRVWRQPGEPPQAPEFKGIPLPGAVPTIIINDQDITLCDDLQNPFPQ